jgi:hypothetical protein
MLWVTRIKPHVDRCASAWVIKRFIGKDAKFEFISKDDPIPEGATAFTLPKAEINSIKGVKTTFDVLLEKYEVEDSVVKKIKEMIRDYEFNEENLNRIQLRETLGLCYVLKELKNIADRCRNHLENLSCNGCAIRNFKRTCAISWHFFMTSINFRI